MQRTAPVTKPGTDVHVGYFQKMKGGATRAFFYREKLKSGDADACGQIIDASSSLPGGTKSQNITVKGPCTVQFIATLLLYISRKRWEGPESLMLVDASLDQASDLGETESIFEKLTFEWAPVRMLIFQNCDAPKDFMLSIFSRLDAGTPIRILFQDNKYPAQEAEIVEAIKNTPNERIKEQYVHITCSSTGPRREAVL